MQYRTIGQTGLRVSEIGFGCGNNAALMVKASHEDQVKAVRHALDQGINFFDTAFAYGWGKSEENLGQMLNELGANPVISTKIWVWKPWLGRTLKGRTIRAVEAGLARLKRERVDFVQLHTQVTSKRRAGDRYSLTPKDVLGSYGVLEGLKSMRERNKVRFFGFSGFGDPEALHELVESGEFHGFQCYYNLLNPSAGHAVPKNFSARDYCQILDRAAAKGMGSFVVRVLAGGALTSDPNRGGRGNVHTISPGSDYPVELERAEKIKSALGVAGKALTQAAIRFGLMNPKVSVVLVGFSNTTHIDEAVACSGMPGFSDEQMGKVKKLWATDFEKLTN
jgi:aryl-alcohol dehydrogenase-like predicted oxidoreductase